MLPAFEETGLLPSGIHLCKWDEFIVRFGYNFRRKLLISGLFKAIQIFKNYGEPLIYIDGSFVTNKEYPNDFDSCWTYKNLDDEILENLIRDYPVFADLAPPRFAQKSIFYGEFMPAFFIETDSQKTFLDFFQIDRETGLSKGIILLDL